MLNFDEKLQEVSKDISSEHKEALIVRLIIMLKMDEIVHYQNFKTMIKDPRGKEVMEYLAEEHKKHILELEQFAPTIPNELKNDFMDLSCLALRQKDKKSTGNGDIVLIEIPDDKTLSKDDSVEDGEDMDKTDQKFIESCIKRKGNSLSVFQRLTECIQSDKCQELLREISKDDSNHRDLLIHNYNSLQNKGEWAGL